MIPMHSEIPVFEAPLVPLCLVAAPALVLVIDPLNFNLNIKFQQTTRHPSHITPSPHTKSFNYCPAKPTVPILEALGTDAKTLAFDHHLLA